MNIGRFTEQVQLQKKTLSYDGVSGTDVSWATVDTIWAMVKPLDPLYLLESSQFGSNTPYRIFCHYRDDLTGETSEVTSLYRLVWNGHEMTIKGAFVQDQKYMFMVIDAVVGPPVQVSTSEFPYTFPLILA